MIECGKTNSSDVYSGPLGVQKSDRGERYLHSLGDWGWEMSEKVRLVLNHGS